jgi:hypothetical protein
MIFFSLVQCCVLSGRGLCVGLITRPEDSYRVWYFFVFEWTARVMSELGPYKHYTVQWLRASRNVVLNAHSNAKFRPFLAHVLREAIWVIQCVSVEIAQCSDNAMGWTAKESLFDLRQRKGFSFPNLQIGLGTNTDQRRPREGGGLPGCSPPKLPRIEILKSQIL